MKSHQIARSGISYVPETRDPFSLLTVEENIMLGHRRGSPYGLSRIIEWFPDLAGLLKRRGAELSGGQQQMMVIGRGLAPGPRLLLLDEPSQGLAPVIVKKVGETLAALRREDLSVVLVEQNIGFALWLRRPVVGGDGKRHGRRSSERDRKAGTIRNASSDISGFTSRNVSSCEVKRSAPLARTYGHIIEGQWTMTHLRGDIGYADCKSNSGKAMRAAMSGPDPKSP